MHLSNRGRHRQTLCLVAAAGGLLLAAIGAGLLWFPAAGLRDGLAHWSYDLPFWLRREVPDELVMIYLDTKVKANLGQPLDRPLDRRFHTRLVERLSRDGAKLILYDLLFDQPGTQPASDEALARAMREHGAVVLAAEYVKQLHGNVFLEAPVPPAAPFATNCAGWGLAGLSPDPADGVVRQLDAGTESFPSLSWVAARQLKDREALPESRRLEPRWLNYYGPPMLFHTVNLDLALASNGLPASLFRNRLVVVGARPEVLLSGAAADAFGTPYSRGGWRLSSGAELHALSLLNIVRGDWLRRVPSPWQFALVTIWGLGLALALMLARPSFAACLAVLGALLLGAGSVWLQLSRQLWWPWMVPALVQAPLALAWSLGWQYALESRRRQGIKRAFAGYLSPQIAERVAEDEFDLALGGKVVAATVMFTDLDGFTSLAETLQPEEVSALLTTYFNQTTRAILEQEGTIIKYMGDAVMAVWGAPLPAADHAERAVRAAWGMHQAGRIPVAGRLLTTRIGLNSGPALAGNLGSAFRFDYTVIGDTTNVASRIESLNKLLGTKLLISQATREGLRGEFSLRCLGRFLLPGKRQSIAVHEVMGLEPPAPGQFPWLAPFEEALRRFTHGEFDPAERLFHQVLAARHGDDGPARFYLEEIARARHRPEPHGPWEGVVILTSK